MAAEGNTAGDELNRMRTAVRRILRRRVLFWVSLPLIVVALVAVRMASLAAGMQPSSPLPLQREAARVRVPVPPPLASAAPAIGGWHLVWQSDFQTGGGLQQWNVVRWAYPYAGELQYYVPANVQVAHGVLALTAKRQSYGGRLYTSGMITTQGKLSLLYGKVLVSAKLVDGQGLWPAIWMLPERGGTDLPELDLLEERGNRPTTVWMSQHWQIASTLASDNHHLFTGPNFATGFHLFGLTWTPNEVAWSVDGVVQFVARTHVPQVPMYLLLNLAIGGVYPGSPTTATPLPQSMDVQWVRVYQRDTPN